MYLDLNDGAAYTSRATSLFVKTSPPISSHAAAGSCVLYGYELHCAVRCTLLPSRGTRVARGRMLSGVPLQSLLLVQ